MSDTYKNRIDDEALENVSGGMEQPETFRVRPIMRTKIRTTASLLHCRYAPDGEIAMDYTYGTILYVDGITGDGLWYRHQFIDPKSKGPRDGYIFKEYTELA